ncbi:ATP-binding cassette domain-containing protein [Tsuneonella sp. CC-YZS046]|uniref:ABC transporter ATP-binding protein n=1 Tax=Tsuneonella sp. CC-YZS046 TaxID=3042152 RepID=UPI002D76CA96|nr:ATP-binding cassette domain-containing protein [Tsuneonella sp. CC-YZS046]WRO67390.1 ATP-binding cassette domain-containing protein [Tsuneonella sp. CC-YZS046]
MTFALEVRGVSKSYGAATVVNGLSCSVSSGEHLLLLGPSGSGKSTLINLITGLLTPDAGEIMIAGEAMTGRSSAARDDLRRRRIGIIFQTLRLVSALNVRGNLRLAQRLTHGRTDDAAIDGLLDALGIAHRVDARPCELSQGEAQRAAIARALVGQPDLLVADEPTSALDDANAEKIALLLVETAKSRGSSLLIATHDQRLRAYIPNSLMLDSAASKAV